MKYIRYIAVIIALGFLASRAEAKLGPLAINLIATQQALNGTGTAVTSKTNITATTTNASTVARFTTTNTIINNAKVLKMLANSFNTNFPHNASLTLNESGHIVVAVGTNSILDANPVLKILFSSGTNVVSELVTESEKLTPAGVSFALNGSETRTTVSELIYDDSLLSTADGATTNFKIEGNLALRMTGGGTSNNGIIKAATTYLVTMTGAGTGTISNKNAFIKGTVTGTTSTPTPPSF